MTTTPIPLRVVFGALLLCVPTVLAAAAIPRLVFGFRIEAARALVQSATFGEGVPIDSARAAASAYELAPPDDGDDMAQGAEFAALGAGGDPAMLSRSYRFVSEALAYAPANPRAWTLLCEFETTHSPARAVACLDTGFYVAPYDWFTAQRRMKLAAFEWPYLDERLRDEAVSLIIPMWNTTQWNNGWINGATLRDTLYELSRSDNGRQLLRAGLISDRETLRSFNRFVMQERLDGR